MPRRDGTGPMSGNGRGRGLGRQAGSTGYCVCPNCGEKSKHERAVPCFTKKCPECGSKMVRQD